MKKFLPAFNISCLSKKLKDTIKIQDSTQLVVIPMHWIEQLYDKMTEPLMTSLPFTH